MSRHANLVPHYARLLTRWPQDPLRPEQQFQRLLQHHQDKITNEQAAEKEINAAYLLLDDTFRNKYPLRKLMRPASAPEHYEALERELREVPHRTWMQRTLLRLRGMVRWR